MSLLNVGAIIAQGAMEDENYSITGLARANSGAGRQSLQQLMESVATSGSSLWRSYDEWSMHELTMAMLAAAGPAEVIICSYALNEDAVRALAMAREAGAIRSLRCLIDNRVDVRAPGSLQLLYSIADFVCLAPCHAKVTLVAGEQHPYSCMGSANHTTNRRYETGLLSRYPEDYDFHFEWITKAFEKHGAFRF